MPFRSIDPLKNLPRPKHQRIPRPPRIRYFTVKPQGPRLYQLGKNVDVANDWFSPPAAFLDPSLHGSAEEWPVYKALTLKLDPGKDPRKPPYNGGKSWSYQKSLQGGRVPGGQVVDFVVDQGGRTLGLRVQTERYHVFADPSKQAFDQYLKQHQSALSLIIDLFTQYFIEDRTGKAVCAQVAMALAGVQMPAPGPFGIGRQARTPR